jgi:aspartyl-tRNA(Asn)/glutamyl-tRNA(Gln) amidotransferase subunit A
MTIQKAAEALRARRVSSAALTQESLATVEKLNPKLNAFLTVTAESALARAHAADEELARGKDLGPLHGVPVALKDVFSTKGVRTTCGSRLFTDHVPDHDCAVAEKLAAAGAVLLGKLNMHELAYGITSNNPHFGPVRNPRDPECVPGGSSGGSGTAVATGMCAMAMGSDTGGSIRIPAAFCGTVGLKPTSGRVSRYGVMPLDFSLDHMGPLTATVRDAALVLQILAGYDSRDDTSSRRAVDSYLPPAGCSIRGLRVGVPENFYFDRLEPDVAASVKAAIARAGELGGHITPVRVPDIAAINTVGRVILLSEASALMEPYMDRREQFGADVLALFDQGRLLAATDYVNAQRLRRVMQREFRKVWSKVDCLLTPTTPNTAPRIGQTTLTIDGQPEDVRLASTRFVRGINVLGLPALSIPCGVDGRKMPIGLQIVGPEFAEALVLRVGATLEDSGLGG